MSAAPTVEELRRQIAAEQAAHKAALDAITQETRNFQAVFDTQQQAFTDLITRVTNLRVAKGEYLAAQATDRTQQISFNTGSDIADEFLYSIQSKLDSPGLSTSASVLQQLETAALEAMTPYGSRRLSALFTSNAAATRHTNLLLLFPNDVRGVRAWAKKHFASCPTCAAKQAQLPPWTPYRYDGTSVGFAAAPNLRAVPDKFYHHVTCSLQQERSMADRMDTEQDLDLLHGTFFLHVQSSQNGQPLPDAETACASMSTALQTFLQEAMQELRETARTEAPWNVAPNVNPDLSAAMEILLHMLEPRVLVRHVAQPAVTRVERTPCTLVQVDVSLTAPLQVSAVLPLLQLLQDPRQRRYVIDKVLIPLAQQAGAAIGAETLVLRYAAVGLQFAESLYRIAVHQKLVPDGTSPTSASATASSTTSVSAATLSQLYFVLQAFAVFNTTAEVEMAVPTVGVEGATSTQDVKKAGLRLVRSLLQHLLAPSPLLVPPPDDQNASNLVVKVSRVPTRFLEICNRTFSSNHRLPSTARNSTLDTFMSPKSKISLGLKLYRELVLELYRPYHPCTGVVLAAENGVAKRPRAPPCVPVVDLPVDCVTANVNVATFAAQCWKDLAALESSTAAQAESHTEKTGKVALEKVAASIQQVAAVDRLRAAWQAAQVTVVEAPKACVDVVLPFSLMEADVRIATKPLLYLRVIYDC